MRTSKAQAKLILHTNKATCMYVHIILKHIVIIFRHLHAINLDFAICIYAFYAYRNRIYKIQASFFPADQIN